MGGLEGEGRAKVSKGPAGGLNMCKLFCIQSELFHLRLNLRFGGSVGGGEGRAQLREGPAGLFNL